MTLEQLTLILQGVFTLLLCYSLYLERQSIKEKRSLQQMVATTKAMVSESRRFINATVDRLDGRMSKALLQSRMAEKLAERSFQLASQANVTMASIAVTLQRRPLPLSKEEQLKNEQIQAKLKEMFGEEQAAFMEPLLSDKDLEILETVTDPKFKGTH